MNVICFSLAHHHIRCCREHDLCYEDLARNSCSSSFFGPYLMRYTWRVNETSLAIECGNIRSFSRFVSCRSVVRTRSTRPAAISILGDTADACKLATCNCDRTAAQCFARHASSYNNAYKRKSFWDFLI